MNRHVTHRHSIFCILPPFVLSGLAQHGTARQRAAALKTMTLSNTFRLLREAHRGSTMGRPPVTAAMEKHKQRTIFNSHNAETFSTDVARSEGSQRTGDAAVDEAYDGLGATFDFYAEVFDRNSIDDAGMPLNGYAHFGQDYDNAFWDGQHMVFGDGDGETFQRFTIALDVIGHELTHGVTEHTCHLQYLNQPGALNESISDVFGSLVKQKSLNQKARDADWLIGKGLLAPGINGVALRSMKEPGSAFDDPRLGGKDPQPGNLSDFVHTFDDNGGVHINSGIPNRAFYLVATRIAADYAWEKAGAIWYRTMQDPHLRPASTFATFARLTALNAAQLYHPGSDEEKVVRGAWKDVGLVLR
jgi:Zn-dependent metalloprotease